MWPSRQPLRPAEGGARSAMAAGIFISYRRQDASAEAHLVYERLAREFGPDEIFIDVDSIEPGRDFVEELSGRSSSAA